MDLDKHRITIRERSYVDILDLALRVVRQYAWPLAVVFFAGVAPTMLLNWWLLWDFHEEDPELGFPLGHVTLMILLIVFEAPLATAPTTLYLGQAMFSERPSLRGVFGEFRRSLPQLLVLQVLLRPLAFFWTYLNEIILLDRNPLRRKSSGNSSTFSRARDIHHNIGGDLFGQWVISVFLGALLVLSWWLSIVMVRWMLLGQMEWDLSLFTVYLPLTVWLAIGFFCVVRFLSYVDLRIRREGWEVELVVRAEGARLTRQWI
jgi:hypothetical protein